MIEKLLDTATRTFSDTDIAKDIKTKFDEYYLHFKLTDENIRKTLYDYLVSIFKTCYYANTLINSNKSIPLNKLFEPVKLKQISTDITNENSKIPNLIDLELILKNHINKNIIIADTAGIGKTTFSKFLVLELLKRNDFKKFPFFVELRKIRNNQSLKNYIIEEINNVSRNTINEKTINHLISRNIFLFILDGYDEVKETNKSFLLKEISTFSNFNGFNTIILTTRKQEPLPKLYQKTIFEFMPLKKVQVINIIKRIDHVYNLNIGKRLIKHTNFNNMDFTLFNTPLMVNLLYIYFSYSNDINNNIVNFYDELFNALYKGHDLTKEGFKREKRTKLSLLNFRKLFCAFSFYSIYYNKTYYSSLQDILEAINISCGISGIQINDHENFLEDITLNVPFLIRDGREYKFIHKTIAEYYSAEFINYPENSTKIISKIKTKKKEVLFKKTFEFLYEINSNLFLNEIGKDFLEYYKNISKTNNPILNMYNSIYSELSIVTFTEKDKLNSVKKQIHIAQNEIIFKKNEDYSTAYILSKPNNYYNYLPANFIKKLVSKTITNRPFEKFISVSRYNINDKTFIFNLNNKTFRKEVFNKTILKDLDLNSDEIIDIKKVNYILDLEVKLEDSLNDLLD